MLSQSDIVEGYLALLDRAPESQQVIDKHLEVGSLQKFLAVLKSSWEFQIKLRPGPLWNYTASFDPVSLVLAYENQERRSVPGHRVNFLGVAVNVNKFFPAMSLDNSVEPAPIPNNWHTDIAEVAGALRAVDLSGETFSMIELGCGWGCWMNITGAAARQRRKKLRLMGVEGDPGHIAFAHEALATNGFEAGEYKLFHGIAAATPGAAFFPLQQVSGQEWGLEAKLHPNPQEAEIMRRSGGYQELPIYALDQIASDIPRIDLLHIDIQGGETDLIRESLELLNRKVAYIVVGTHSRKIDGDILDMLVADGGWALEIERPSIITIDGDHLTLRIDGVQGWRNKRF